MERGQNLHFHHLSFSDDSDTGSGGPAAAVCVLTHACDSPPGRHCWCVPHTSHPDWMKSKDPAVSLPHPATTPGAQQGWRRSSRVRRSCSAQGSQSHRECGPKQEHIFPMGLAPGFPCGSSLTTPVPSASPATPHKCHPGGQTLPPPTALSNVTSNTHQIHLSRYPRGLPHCPQAPQPRGGKEEGKQRRLWEEVLRRGMKRSQASVWGALPSSLYRASEHGQQWRLQPQCQRPTHTLERKPAASPLHTSSHFPGLLLSQ